MFPVVFFVSSCVFCCVSVFAESVPEDVPEDDFRDAEGVTLLPDDVLPEEALAEEVLLPLFFTLTVGLSLTFRSCAGGLCHYGCCHICTVALCIISGIEIINYLPPHGVHIHGTSYHTIFAGYLNTISLLEPLVSVPLPVIAAETEDHWLSPTFCTQKL